MSSWQDEVFETKASPPTSRAVAGTSCILRNTILMGRRDPPYFPRGFEAVHDRHGEVENDDVGRELPHHGNCVSAISGVATNLPITIWVQQCPQAQPHNLVIVRN